MTMTIETKKPTLKGLGIADCSIAYAGISQREDHAMLSWSATFTGNNGIKETFFYYTGLGLVPWEDRKVKSASNLGSLNWKQAKIVELGNKRWGIKDKALLALTAESVAMLSNWKPCPIDILNALAMGFDSTEQTFEDWASDYGYDTDSRNAENVYRQSQQEALRLKRLVGPSALNLLRSLEL